MPNPTQLCWHALNESERVRERESVRIEDRRKRESEEKNSRVGEREREKNIYIYIYIIIIQACYSTILHIKWYCSSIVKKITSLEGRMEWAFYALMVKYINICHIQLPMGMLL